MHFACLVVGENVDAELEPFSEHREVPPYQWFLDADEIALMAKDFDTDPSDLLALATHLKEWRQEDGGMEGGRLFTWSTLNPQAKWDWYQAGGRFGGYLTLRTPRVEKSWFGLRRRLVSNVTRARKVEVDSMRLLSDPPVALLHRGTWHEGRVGVMQRPGPDWIAAFSEAYGRVGDDETLNAMDLHS